MKRLIGFFLLIGVLGICWTKIVDFKDESQTITADDADRPFHSNPDVYAQVDVDGTSIHYPIAQHPTDDSYYLSHDSDNHATIYGAVFTERVNKKEFHDPVTIIYGHATRDGSMFGTLSNFADAHFFNENKSITIQTKQEIILYEVFAAYRFTDEHLYETYHLDNDSNVSAYFEKIKDYAAQSGGNYRDITMSSGKKLLILSTCDAEDGGRRFVVHAIERERKER